MSWKIIFRRKVRRIKRAKKPSPKYLKHKEVARELVKQRIEHFNTFYNFKFGRIAIKDTKSRWGSCSKQGNLNFNYRIILLPPHLADYLIVHELCHLGEFNHSKNFWALVAQTIPNWEAMRQELKNWKHREARPVKILS